MNLPYSGRSATIYQFPKDGRRASAFARKPLRSVADAAPAPFIMEGSWYHEEAMREEAEASKRDANKPN